METVRVVSMKRFISYGSGEFSLADFVVLGDNVIFEVGVLVFHA